MRSWVPAEGYSSYIYGRLPHSVQYHANATIKDPDLCHFAKGGGKGKKVQAEFCPTLPSRVQLGHGVEFRTSPGEFSC